MRTTAAIFHAWIDGKKLGNQELLRLRKALEAAADSCSELGPTFHLAFKEATTRFHAVDDVVRARGLLKKP